MADATALETLRERQAAGKFAEINNKTRWTLIIPQTICLVMIRKNSSRGIRDQQIKLIAAFNNLFYSYHFKFTLMIVSFVAIVLDDVTGVTVDQILSHCADIMTGVLCY